MKTITESDICRICLKKEEKEESDIRQLKFFELSAIEAFDYLFGIKVKIETLAFNNVPRKVCQSCQAEVCIGLRVKKLALESDGTIGETESGEGTQIKNEPALDIENDIFFEGQIKNEPVIEGEVLIPVFKIEEEQFSCDHCLLKFETKLELIEHLPIHFCNEERRPKPFAKSKKLSKHFEGHTKEKPEANTCSKLFLDPTELSQHTHASLHQCELCTRNFKTAASLKVHARCHSQEQYYKCTHCTKSFSCTATLKIHLRIHTGERPYKCTYCPKSFTTKANMTCHARSHTGERPFKCEICSKAFVFKSNLASHLRIHTGEKPYQCGLCPKSFTQCVSLQYHLKTHKKK